MRTLDWWWDRWHNYSPEQWHDKALFFRHSHDLEVMIRKQPLTEDLVLEFVQNHIGQVNLEIYTCIRASREPYKFVIGFDQNRVREKDYLAHGGIHECVHGIYRAKGWGPKIEEIIDKEAARFFEANPEFSHDIRRRFVAMVVEST